MPLCFLCVPASAARSSLGQGLGKVIARFAACSAPVCRAFIILAGFFYLPKISPVLTACSGSVAVLFAKCVYTCCACYSSFLRRCCRFLCLSHIKSGVSCVAATRGVMGFRVSPNKRNLWVHLHCLPVLFYRLCNRSRVAVLQILYIFALLATLQKHFAAGAPVVSKCALFGCQSLANAIKRNYLTWHQCRFVPLSVLPFRLWSAVRQTSRRCL